MAGEPSRREQLAASQRQAAAALALVDSLAREERFHEALGVLDSADSHEYALELTLARARILRDLGRLTEADEVLAPTLAPAVHPRFLWEAALVAHARGDRAALRERLAALEGFASHAFVEQIRPALASFQAQANGDQPLTLTEGEVLALLRSSKDTVIRLRALRTLAAMSLEGRRAALRIGSVDPSPAVRAATLRAGLDQVTDASDWIRGGLEDEAAMVRGTAAQLAPAALKKDAIVLLTDFLQTESDGYVVLQIHQALGTITGRRHELPVGWEQDAAGRDRVRALWRQAWVR